MRNGLWVLLFTFFGVIGVASIGEAQVGGWVSANAIFVQPATTSLTQTDSFPYRFETFTDDAKYVFKSKPSFDIGGGVRFLTHLGLGIAVSRYSDSEPATIDFSVPHPTQFNRPATASGPTSGQLKAEETAVHVEARYIANMPHASFSVFAGPSHFQTKRDIVTDFSYRETLVLSTLAYSVTLTGNTTRTVDLSAWGLNVGADVGYFFSENTGIGALVRFSRAKVNLPNELRLPAITDSFNIGGLSVGGGVRLRF